MRKIAAGLFTSLDGVVESPENRTRPYFNDQVGQAVGALMASNDALLLGQATYEGFAAAFGGQSGGMADRMSSTPKYVVSSTLTSAGCGTACLTSWTCSSSRWWSAAASGSSANLTARYPSRSPAPRRSAPASCTSVTRRFLKAEANSRT
jgi:hypothetical protein